MKKKIYLGFSTLLGSTISKDVKFALKNDFNALCLELSWNPNLNFSKQEILDLKLFSSKGNKLLIHLPSFLPTNSNINEISEGAINYFKKVLSFAKKVGAEIITFHSGYVENNNFRISLIKNLQKIIPFARSLNITLSIENDDMMDDYPLWNLDENVMVLNSFKDLKFTYDPGHANTVKIEAIKFFEKIKKWTNVVHLHNNFGKDTHNSLDNGSIDFSKLLPKILNFKEDIILILEVFPHKNVLYNKNLISTYLDSL